MRWYYSGRRDEGEDDPWVGNVLDLAAGKWEVLAMCTHILHFF